MSSLVSVEQLDSELLSGVPIRLLDVRWRFNEPEGRPAYLNSHLPRAVYVDLERELSRLGHPEEGRFPLPDMIDLEHAARRWGVNQSDRVVVYDDNDSVAAARAWWLLRGYGVDVRVLDGGFRAWLNSGGQFERGDHAARPGDISLAPFRSSIASIDEAATAHRSGILIDVRSPQYYRGHAAGTEPVGGHIPGAINIPTITHMSADGRLLPGDEIRAALHARGVEPSDQITLYCNNGIASLHSALAFESAGYPARVFPGGWSQWTRSAGRPVAVGWSPSEVIVTA